MSILQHEPNRRPSGCDPSVRGAGAWPTSAAVQCHSIADFGGQIDTGVGVYRLDHRSLSLGPFATQRHRCEEGRGEEKSQPTAGFTSSKCRANR
jgi:hypothetical protein